MLGYGVLTQSSITFSANRMNNNLDAFYVKQYPRAQIELIEARIKDRTNSAGEEPGNKTWVSNATIDHVFRLTYFDQKLARCSTMQYNIRSLFTSFVDRTIDEI